MIKTDRFALTSIDYFWIILISYLKRRWWLILFMWVSGLLFLLKRDEGSFVYIFMFFAFLYPLIIFIQFWIFAKSKDNKLFLIERYFEISEEGMTGVLIDGSASVIKKNNFIRTVELSKYYLLYISKSQFVFIPKNAFLNQQDKDWFIKTYMNKKV